MNPLSNLLKNYKVPDIICPLCRGAMTSITLKLKPDSKHETYGWICGCNEFTRSIYDQGRGQKPVDRSPVESIPQPVAEG